jgi:hypothetical protein
LKLGLSLFRYIDRISYPPLIVVALVLGLSPFRPMPHIVEKLLLLKTGQLTRPLDIFDLVYHLAPFLVLVVKMIRDYRRHRVALDP